MLLLLALLAAPTLIRGPVIVGTSPDQAFITWETSESQSNGTVRFGSAAGVYTGSVQDPANSENHHVTLSGLLPGATYHFAIDSDVNHEDSRFTTAPAAGTRPSFKFGLYGDNRTQAAPHQAVVQALQAEGPLAFLIQTGDMAENLNPLANGWDIFFALEHDLLRTTPLFPTVGNHETLDGLKHWAEFFAAPSFAWPVGTPKYTSMDWGQAHFAFLDSFESTIPGTEGISQAQVEWMKADLDDAKARGQVLFAVLHHGPYSHSQHGPNLEAQQLIVPELAARGVAAIFQGHDHVYERGCGGGLDYILAGGGGAPLYAVDAAGPGVQHALSDYSYAVITVSGATVTGVAKLTDGGVIDTFTLPSGACGTPDGGVVAPDGGVTTPDGGVIAPDGGVTAPDGGVVAPDGGVATPDAGSLPADGGAVSPQTLANSGCSCGGATGLGWSAAFACAALALARRRRS